MNREMHSQAFPKKYRVRKRGEYLSLQKEGKLFSGKFLMIRGKRGQREKYVRMGMVVSRKYGKAHERNFFKRRMREIFRRHRDLIPSHSICIVFPRYLSKQASFWQLKKEFLSLVARL